ncbi:sulfurtransferase complex subunit TusD [Paraglaciecola polaris]|uniref:Sulfurtransferase tusD n=1 Tax=Paraglaciecola polaris LMG 21857 TaxID=1129793 RepID=K6ZL86_9ALTE|nr:sulfurtransferase complex subunit TusD [Paraglaciecola polaris]GAC31097.1 sulfurtransferase tusD [Paraglaciecola polaris LMG 21857]|tara:strand:- start:108 stop:497 length:390 start_codon:yes stop_codon:yes gene_type:complete
MAAFSLLVTHAPFEQQYAFSAYRFVRSALNLGHEIKGVFFYQAGVQNANRFQAGHSDEFDLYAAWVELGTQFAIPLNVCVTAANRRGVINKQDAIENSQQGFNLAEPFAEVGLGSLVELMQVSDRVIQF